MPEDTLTNQENWLDTIKNAKKSDKSWRRAFLLSLFLGPFGADRFYLGYKKLGMLKLLTGAGFGIWYVIDVMLLFFNKLPDADDCELEK